MKKNYLALIKLLAVFLLFSSTSNSQVPKIMNYQASMLDEQNKPLTGNVVLTFSIFTDETTGVIPIWTEVQNVEVINGFMNTYLGQIVPLNLPFDSDYWLEVKIGDSSPYPRKRLTSAPYSIHSLTAVKADTADIAFTVVDGAITQVKLDPGVKAIPWGNAGGALTGQYPNPSLNKDTILNFVDDNFFRRDEALLGDLSGTIESPVVSRIRGIPVSPEAPLLWHTFVYDGTKWKPSYLTPFSLNANVPAQDEVLFYRYGNFEWDIPAPAGPAGGDLTGSYPNPSVAQIRGVPVSLITPVPNRTFIFDGISWVPSLLYPANLYADVPVNGEYLSYQSGTFSWSPATVAGLVINSATPFSTFAGYQSGTANTGLNNTLVGFRSGYSNTTGGYNTANGSNAFFMNTAGNYNTVSGYQALYMNTTGSFNTAIGVNALFSNSSASYNTATGFDALYSNTTGANNAAFGYLSLYNNTTGNENTGIGDNTLNSNTTGNQNTATGAAALYSNTSGANNTAVGSASLQNNTIGNNNTAAGQTALFSNTTGSNNTGVGSQALLFNTTGGQNTAVGNNALENNTTGDWNTAVGFNALWYNSTGSSNVATGSQALYNNTTGNGNTANGENALHGNTTGNNNTASGQASLYNNTTGSNNSAFGLQALYSNSTGNSNTAGGLNALFSNTTGNANTAFGLDALYTNTTGGSNSAMGYQALFLNTVGMWNTATGNLALYSNTTGSNNTADGDEVLYSNTTGAYNTGIGIAALYQNTGGNYNTALGANTLFSMIIGAQNTAIGYSALNQAEGSWNTAVGFNAGNSNVSGDGNVFIGYRAGESELGSNKLYIANTGINPPLIYGDFSTARVAIGTITPSATPFTVVGLPAYPNNAAAIAGGLTVGAFYRTGGDPDVVCVVH